MAEIVADRQFKYICFKLVSDKQQILFLEKIKIKRSIKMTTAVLEVESKESLSKLLKTAKIFGIYAKERNEKVKLRKGQLSEEEKTKLMQERALAALNRIQKASVEAGLDKMTLEEINAEITEARKERAIREKCKA